MRAVAGVLLLTTCAVLSACSGDGALTSPHVAEAPASAAYAAVEASHDPPADCPLITTAAMASVDPTWWGERGYSDKPPVVKASPGTIGRTLFCRWESSGSRIWVALGIGDLLDDRYGAQQDAAVAHGSTRDGSVVWGVDGVMSFESPSTAINVWFNGDNFGDQARARAYRDAVLAEIRRRVVK